MTVYNTKSYVRYTADGVQTSFPVSFVFHAMTDIEAYLVDDKDRIALQNPQDYTIQGVENSASVLFSTPPKRDITVVIERKQPQIQTMELHANSSLDLGVLERTLDSLVLMIQDASQQVQRLQEDGELPTTEDYKRFDKYIEKALHVISKTDSSIEERYQEILGIYEIIKELGNNNGGSAESEDASVALLEHNSNKLSHNCRLIPTGCVAYFISSFIPEGWLVLEKKVYKRELYPELATLIYCGDDRNDNADYGFYCSNPEDPNGSRSTVGEYFMLGPDLRGEFIRGLDLDRGIDVGRTLGTHQDASLGSHSHYIRMYSTNLGRGGMKIYAPEIGEESSLSYNGGSESYPRNVALIACVKY